jgi:hypothetical protein
MGINLHHSAGFFLIFYVKMSQGRVLQVWSLSHRLQGTDTGFALPALSRVSAGSFRILEESAFRERRIHG